LEIWRKGRREIIVFWGGTGDEVGDFADHFADHRTALNDEVRDFGDHEQL
jgi:hypothetical protein